MLSNSFGFLIKRPKIQQNCTRLKKFSIIALDQRISIYTRVLIFFLLHIIASENYYYYKNTQMADGKYSRKFLYNNIEKMLIP